MSRRRVRNAALSAVAVVLTTAAAHAQTSDQVEQLRREYDQQLRIMQQAFEERMAALEEKLEPQDSDFNWYWKDGLRFDTADGRFKFRFNGRIQWDNVFYSADGDLEDAYEDDFEDGSEFRRARLEVTGTIYDDFFFKAQYDFAGGDADFKDVYMGADLPFGKLTAGHFKEPFSLNELTSSKDVVFMERALPIVFAPSRNAGLMYSNAFADDMVTVAAGIFRDADDFGDADGEEEEWAVTGRITARPWVTDDGDKYVHLGAAASYRNADDDESSLRYRQRPESHLTSVRLVDTGGIDGWEDTQLYGVEAAVVVGPFHAEAEYLMADASFDDALSAGVDDATFDGWYVQAGWFLTGEHRRYKASSGVFDKVKPNSNFQITGDGGLGAWEVAARYSSIDLDDGGIDGGVEDNVSLALNWYLNPNMRIGLNYTHAMVDDRTVNGIEVDDSLDIVQSRFQVTW